MGVYYFFFNITKDNQQNKHVLNGLFCDFVTKFHLYNTIDQTEIFQKCIQLNHWDLTDTLLAVPDYSEYDIIKYQNGVISIDNSNKNNYFVI